ncbi:sigma-70 family RNA polymerase sigma factor [Adhaeribacter arboris]|uniref:Sigma-70 family RNA polymerase sigma factor n=1 Tax=Adhaeribacter arboris TaxID=2072846 RepID=A0A2T2YMX1_9BACT|nr:sigma-70 family RNA polymerase sigma factor [Adhaeribacter arboris]PSR56860.1 sigma-70 family RNA polymerase sigma factor [Adhaeribacter arboris]
MQTILHPHPVTNWRQSLIADREKTLEKIYARAYPMVLHYVKQHGGYPEDAQDLVQEALIIFYEKIMLEELTLTASVTTYLMGICKNLWRRELEKRQRREEWNIEKTDVAEEVNSPEPDSPTLELIYFVEQLGNKCRDILVAFYYFGQPMPAIAQQHEYRSVHSASVQKFKCLERLRKSLAALTVHHFR